MHKFFKDTKLPKEINYCIQNIQHLPTIDLKTIYEKDKYSTPAPKQYVDAQFSVLIHRKDNTVEVKEFKDQLFILNSDDERLLNNFLQLIAMKLYNLNHTNLDLEPLLNYKKNIDTIYTNRFVQKNIPSIFNHVYNKHHKNPFKE